MSMARADCPKCGGTGWRTVAVESAAPTAGGRGVAGKGAHAQARSATAGRQAALCECAGDDRYERLLAATHIPRRYEHCDFGNYDIDLQHDETEGRAWNQSRVQAKLVAEAFAREYPQVDQTGMLLMGPCGVGKTHLAVAVLKAACAKGALALYCDYRELLKQIQASYNPVSQTTEMEVLDPVLTAELLLLDDLGSSKPSPWALETVGHILNTRYNEKRVTLITTNYLDTAPGKDAPRDTFAEKRTLRMPSGQAIAEHREESLAQRIGERIRSRLYEMCRTVEIYAPDYRKEIRQAGRLRP
ncbi:MAG: ATP-binding protein [Candidatus Acidiferrales bacterium]